MPACSMHFSGMQKEPADSPVVHRRSIDAETIVLKYMPNRIWLNVKEYFKWFLSWKDANQYETIYGNN